MLVCVQVCRVWSDGQECDDDDDESGNRLNGKLTARRASRSALRLRACATLNAVAPLVDLVVLVVEGIVAMRSG